MNVLFNIIIVLLLVLANGFFVAAEFASVKVRKSRIDTLVIQGNPRAKYIQRIVTDLNSYLSACQLGITLASLGLGWVGEPAVSRMLEPLFRLLDMSERAIHSVSFIIAFTIITGMHIVLGELAPKSLAIISAESVAMNTALPLIIFYKVTYPIIWVFNHTSNLVLKMFGMSQVDDHESAHTDEEIKLLVEESYKHGLIDKTELTFVDNIFDFSEKTVREVMVPRTEMVCVYKEDSFDEIIKMSLSEQLTRFPVCLNNKDNIIGYVHVKDLYKMKIEGNDKNIDNIIRETITIPESMSISLLLKKFQKEKEQIAIVIDEYGGTAGLVTAEDILEEIVGEIQDEFDEEGELIQQLEKSVYVVDGKVMIHDINELLDINIESEDIDTIGGWIYSKLELPPQVNQTVNYEGYEFLVSKCDRKRIYRITIRKINEK
ncbi:membrane protein [Clostridium polyendosporum]|uniref:Membrane protein n=1 Tax=Clostridium polyendosporum TaxID=69208 RepID=A0A919VDP6_9CLOT|nr:hemolysin family protein [Clostridium polyendosporum]GIM28244.1 membrane protein [Clostridium polyendosporum]